MMTWAGSSPTPSTPWPPRGPVLLRRLFDFLALDLSLGVDVLRLLKSCGSPSLVTRAIEALRSCRIRFLGVRCGTDPEAAGFALAVHGVPGRAETSSTTRPACDSSRSPTGWTRKRMGWGWGGNGMGVGKRMGCVRGMMTKKTIPYTRPSLQDGIKSVNRSGASPESGTQRPPPAAAGRSTRSAAGGERDRLQSSSLHHSPRGRPSPPSSRSRKESTSTRTPERRRPLWCYGASCIARSASASRERASRR